MITSILITGVGGQGTVLMSRLIGTAAIAAGLEVRGSETIGMAQRGGSVVSHIRMGLPPCPPHSPLIPPGTADCVIAFEPAEAVRVLPFLSPAGRMLVLDRGVMPVSASLGETAYDPREMTAFLTSALPPERLTIVRGGDLIAQCGSPRVVNAALLGTALAKNYFPFSPAHLREALKSRLPSHYLELNLKALELGISLGS
ncbi:MAG: indolepyruvate oxidoreductase subunit beta [Treponema sp.]|jgi:indolepyruvate ferredoxin oxidoreductase beta subunit|nr:indolepyruvate oxidoreductase subunit beta [Treponema sp.]